MSKFYILLVLCFCNICNAQEIPLTTQHQIEQLADASSTELEDDQLLLQLDYFRRHPLHLNSVTKEELQALHLLTDLQVILFISYRKVAGKLIDIHELQAVPGWDAALIRQILPYVTLNDAVNVKENFLARRDGEHSILLRGSRIMERARGFEMSSGTKYLGDRLHLMMRYRYQYKDLLYAGISGDKDAGEQFFRGVQSKGFDFYSFHFFMRKLGIIKVLALGDYMVNLGQGLISWQSTGFGKSAEVMAIKRSSPVLLPYRAVGESGFYRGAGITIGGKNLDATFFVSMKKISGHIEDSAGIFTGINSSGYNRTMSELAKRNKINQMSIGGKIGLAIGQFNLGLNTMLHRFSIPLLKKVTPYNTYAFAGKELMHLSLDFSYTFRNIHVFGEMAADKAFRYALVAGAMISADPVTDLSFVYRSMSKEFTSLFGNAFSENTLPVNEKGLFVGIAFRPASRWKFNTYADIFHFPWLRFSVNAPSRGYDFLVQAGYQPNKLVEMYLRYKNKNKPLDAGGDPVIRYPKPEARQNLRFHLANQVTADLTIKSRVEIVWYQNSLQATEQGFLGFVEFGFKPLKWMGASLRFQYFETAGYNTRIYAYETDILGGFSIPAFYNKGFRYLVNLEIAPSKNLRIWTRWACSSYKGLNQVGAGADTIEGPRQSELKLQIRLFF